MRSVLLDTHVFLWSQFEPEKLPEPISSLFQADDVRWVFSQISLWEIQIKFDLGKLPLPDSPEILIAPTVERAGFAVQPLQDAAIFLLGKLPSFHRDPFDRLLIATALANGWEIATVDRQFDQYPVRILH